MIVLVSIVFLWGRIRMQEQKEAEAYELGKKAYIYAYPLVLMHITKEAMTATPYPTGHGCAPINQFDHIQKFPTPQIKTVVRPNMDTLYSVAWLDLSKEPQILSIPKMDDRYYVFQILDAWTEVIANPGTRTTGKGAQTYLIAGPTWNQKVPDGIEKISSPTNLAWIVGRIQTNGSKDIAHVQELQKGFTLTPLSQWGKIIEHKKPPKFVVEDFIPKRVPAEEIFGIDAEAFFTLFSKLLKENPPHEEDHKIVAELEKIGLTDKTDLHGKNIHTPLIKGLKRAVREAQEIIKKEALQTTGVVNGWKIALQNIGIYGTNYLSRAGIAYLFLGANRPEDAVYPTTFIDQNGNFLMGNNCYQIHFNKEEIPPINAFWSITLYGPDSFLVENPISRYTLGDRDPLTFNRDGSLDIYIQRTSPGKNKESNWLPAPEKTFNLSARLYWPKESVLNGTWHMPPVTLVTCP